jgi:ketosteroid isomerase-like protein
MCAFASGVSMLLLAAMASPQELSLSKKQQEVWNREEAYWTAVRSRNADAYIALWREDFVGWPYFDHDPIRKSDLGKDPFPLARNAENTTETRDVTRKAVQLFGDTAVVHYLVTTTSSTRTAKALCASSALRTPG